jgi:hypothetical protein
MGQEGSGTLVSMNAALRRQCSAIQKLLGEAAVGEIYTRYKVGAIIRSVIEAHGTYGDRAVDRIAEALGRDAGTLYRYAFVARTWSEPEMRALSRRPNSHGEPLSWSHWVELTRVPMTWQVWFERALEGSWSARKLARELETEPKATSVDSPVMAANDTTGRALRHAVDSIRRFDAEVTTSFEPVLERIRRMPNHERSKVGELLATALDLVEDAHKKTGALALTMRELASKEPARVGSRNAMPFGMRGDQ